MTKEQSKAHWWIVENHPDFSIQPPKKYFKICDIVFNALNQGQLLSIDSVSRQRELLKILSKHIAEQYDLNESGVVEQLEWKVKTL